MAANTFPVARVNKSSAPSINKNLRRAVCAEYMRDFDMARVAAMFDTDESVIRRVINSDEMQKHLDSSLGDVSKLDAIAARRLLETLLEEAFQKVESKGRTEARKILSRHYLPKRSETKTEHRYFLEVPPKMEQSEWEARYAGRPALDGVHVDDEGNRIIPADLVDD